MGTDTPISALSTPRPKLLYTYFKQNLRPGHQPADRPDPRRTGDVAGILDRPAAQPAGYRLDGPQAEAARGPAARPDQQRDLEKIRSIGEIADNAVPHADPRHHLSGRTRCRRHAVRRSIRCAPRPRRRAGRLQHHHSIPTVLSAEDRVAIPALLARRRSIITSSARACEPLSVWWWNRRGARSASFLHAGRLWRRGDQPLSGVRDPARSNAANELPEKLTEAESRIPSATSRRSTRAS